MQLFDVKRGAGGSHIVVSTYVFGGGGGQKLHIYIGNPSCPINPLIEKDSDITKLQSLYNCRGLLCHGVYLQLCPVIHTCIH